MDKTQETAYVGCKLGTCSECDEQRAEYEAQGCTVKTLNGHYLGLYSNDNSGSETMDDSERIQRETVRAECENREIDGETARLIASQWHGGQDSLLYAFASTGNLASSVHDTWGEVASDYTGASATERRALDFLGTYLLHLQWDNIDPETGAYRDGTP